MSWLSEKLGAKASARMAAPMARKDDLVVEDVADEVLIYDQRNERVHCLTREAAMVWRVSDGRTAPSALAGMLGLSQEAVSAALDQLEAAELLETLPTPGITRREATIRMAKVGGAAAAAPVIYSIMAPTPALAASQAFCLGLGCITTQGCGACHNCGCACCGPGNSTSGGENKICTADCTSTNCTPAIIAAHCQTAGTTAACNTGGGTGQCHIP